MIPGVKTEPPLLGWATALCKEVDPTARGMGRGHIMTQACPGVTSDNGDRGCYPPPSWAPHPRAEEGVDTASSARAGGCVCKGDPPQGGTEPLCSHSSLLTSFGCPPRSPVSALSEVRQGVKSG